jgi:hypothetical protein
MFSWFKRRKEKKLEKEYGDLDTAILSGADAKKPQKIEQYVVERLEQIIELTKETEEAKAEYRIVNAYLNDIQMLEDMPEEERKPIEETATNVVQLNASRNEFLNASKKISDAQFSQMEQQESEIPSAIRRLSANEVYCDTLKRDMKYLEREKSEWTMRKEFLEHNRQTMKLLLYVLTGLAVTAVVILVFLQLVLEWDMYYGWMALVFITAVAACVIYLKMQNDITESNVAEKNINRAIVLLNKIKIKYVGIANAVDYVCEKYHVRSAKELSQNWDYYLEAVKEREKYQRTNEDLEYFNGRLVRQLSKYRFYDAKVWISQAQAIIDPKEMVEVKHEMIGRRQKLRAQIEYNMQIIMEQREEAEKLVDKVGSVRPQVEEILSSIDKLTEHE